MEEDTVGPTYSGGRWTLDETLTLVHALEHEFGPSLAWEARAANEVELKVSFQNIEKYMRHRGFSNRSANICRLKYSKMRNQFNKIQEWSQVNNMDFCCLSDSAKRAEPGLYSMNLQVLELMRSILDKCGEAHGTESGQEMDSVLVPTGEGIEQMDAKRRRERTAVPDFTPFETEFAEFEDSVLKTVTENRNLAGIAHADAGISPSLMADTSKLPPVRNEKTDLQTESERRMDSASEASGQRFQELEFSNTDAENWITSVGEMSELPRAEAQTAILHTDQQSGKEIYTILESTHEEIKVADYDNAGQMPFSEKVNQDEPLGPVQEAVTSSCDDGSLRFSMAAAEGGGRQSERREILGGGFEHLIDSDLAAGPKRLTVKRQRPDMNAEQSKLSQEAKSKKQLKTAEGESGHYFEKKGTEVPANKSEMLTAIKDTAGTGFIAKSRNLTHELREIRSKQLEITKRNLMQQKKRLGALASVVHNACAVLEGSGKSSNAFSTSPTLYRTKAMD
ncbi:protein MpTRIHELIX28 [Marchantia polymorpha subsp. ruderalis]|uniref:Myb/SANT-like DNA-binding domain-containing protein n=1 Tax=Marchantia polymorpha TaxID=3197 RepID=A0A2R6W9S6_MARPO|nr:hypothetical protein MARPO_0122s0030 [Marchantia polymorpha]BBN02570.1 hypothetical protein Mp_2g16340 [Marchantia polymorpha subsp. ruderalis]|eukprot:PTQ30599.1 hypothetical protein MARPO_0122s0030 [Marchantia polymorpha]